MALSNFATFATNVFTCKAIEEKREAAKAMIAAMQSTESKKNLFRQQILTMTAGKLDKFAADCFLVDTDKVIA